jgi:hypothetical protein
MQYEKHEQKAFGKRVLKSVFEAKKDEIVTGVKILYREDLILFAK